MASAPPVVSIEELDRARAAFLVPGIRRGWVTSGVPIVVMIAIFAFEDPAGTAVWGAIRIVLSVLLYRFTGSLGDGTSDPPRTFRRLRIAMAIGSIGWGLLPVLVRSDQPEWQTLILIPAVGNLLVVSATCAADVGVWWCAAAPVFTLSFATIVIDDGPGRGPLLGVLAMSGIYTFGIFRSTYEMSIARFTNEVTNRALHLEVERRQADVVAANERLTTALEHLSITAEERAAVVAALRHDIAGPIATIRLSADLLAAPGAMEDVGAPSRIARIRSESSRLTELVKVFGASSAPTTPVELRREPVELRAAAIAAVSRHGGDQRMITLDGVAADLRALADPLLVGRILDNLLSNAVKYAPDGEIRVAATQLGSEIHLSVSDAGPGLPVELGDDAFELSTRGPGTASTPGQGIGLFLVRTFARVQGGRAWWEPERPAGSRFVVALPAADPG